MDIYSPVKSHLVPHRQMRIGESTTLQPITDSRTPESLTLRQLCKRASAGLHGVLRGALAQLIQQRHRQLSVLQALVLLLTPPH